MTGLLHHLALTLKLNFRSKQAIIYGYVVPIFFLFALGSVFASKPPLRDDMGRLLTVTILGGACFGMPTTMVAERERGVWRRYRLLPAATGGIILSAMVARFFIILSAAVMQIFLAHYLPIYRTPFPEHPLGMLFVFLFVCLAFLGMGLVIAMVAETVPAVQALGQAIFLPLIIIGGVGVKLESLPHGIQHIASFLPGIYSVQALQVCQRGAGLADARIPFNLMALTVIGLAALVAGAKMFRWDVGQKLTGSARRWVAMAVVAWAVIGIADQFTRGQRSHAAAKEIAAKPRIRAKDRLASPFPHGATAIILNVLQTPNGLNSDAPAVASQATPAGVMAITRSVDQFTSAARSLLPPGDTAATAPATGPAVVIAPAPGVAAPWEKVTKAQSDSVTYDDLPDDNSTNTPLAPDLNGLDDDGKKRMDNFSDALSDWAPGKVEDVPQRIRNLLSICGVRTLLKIRTRRTFPISSSIISRARLPSSSSSRR